MSELNHPGTITIVNEQTGEERTESAEKTPLQHRFVNGVPMVRAVLSVAGNQRTIREYGPQGQLLRTNVSFR